MDEKTRTSLRHRMNIFSCNQEALISESVQIYRGPPAVYQLIAKKETIGTLSRLTVGERDEMKINKTILLVGETGAEKSTLIDSLFNYAVGVKFSDELWFQIVENEKKSHQTQSQTSGVIVYQIFGFEDQTLPFSLTIIDTPGYGDTAAFNHNTRINQQLMELLQSDDGVHEVHAVGLVMKEGENPVSDRLKNIYGSIKSLFGKDVEKNIVALMTNSQGRKPENVLQALEAADIKCAKDEKNQTVYFQFDNRQDEERTEESELSIENAWRVTGRGMRQFTDFLEKSAPHCQTSILELHREQIRLTACIQNLQERIRFTELKLRDAERTQEAVCENEQEMKRDQKFYVNIPETEKAIEFFRDVSYGYETAVGCLRCKENCLYPGCTEASEPEQCEVMIDEKCTSCTNKCPASDHVTKNRRNVIRTKKVQRNKEALEHQYNQEAGEKLKLSERLEKEKIKLIGERRQLIHEAHGLFVSLYELVKNDDSVSTYAILDFLIKKMKGQGDEEKLQQLEEIYDRMDERTRISRQQRMKMSSANQEALNSESYHLHPGPPAVYQLIPKKKKIGTLSRLTVGERDEKKINKTILLVGETGAGKSTLIDALFNYAVGVKFEDEVWFQIVEEEKSHQSQTSDVIVYQIFGYEGQTLPFSLTIIDTPGFGSTIWKEHDDVSHRLLDLFRSEDGVDEINAVGLVMKASDNRLNDRLMNVFDSVTSLFGKDLEKNLVTLITHSDGRTPENALQALEAAKIKCSKDEKNQPVHFMFNNQQTQRNTTEEDKLGSKYFWNFTSQGIDRFIHFMNKTKSQTLIKTVEVLNERISLTACIQNLKVRTELCELKQTEISQIKEAYQKLREEMKNKNFTVEVDEVYKERGPTRWFWTFGTLLCLVCEENCHPECELAISPAWCQVMRNGRCTVCTRKCPASAHIKEKWSYETKTRKVQKILKDVKEEYEENEEECATKLSLMENLEKEIIKLSSERPMVLDETYHHIIRLELMSVYSGNILVDLDFLLEEMKKRGDQEKVRELESLKTRMD